MSVIVPLSIPIGNNHYSVGNVNYLFHTDIFQNSPHDALKRL